MIGASGRVDCQSAPTIGALSNWFKTCISETAVSVDTYGAETVGERVEHVVDIYRNSKVGLSLYPIPVLALQFYYNCR